MVLGFALGDNPFGHASLILALGCLIGAAIWWLSRLKGTDPYDLKALHRIHEDEERRAIEDELAEIDSAGNAVCLNCGTHFDPQFHRCPRCGKSIY